VPALILGKYPYVPHYDGVDRNDPPPPLSRGHLHSIDVQTYPIDGIDYWITSLRLFAHSGLPEHGMPIYRTVVGKKLS
jgi:hypothetical protein